MTVRVRVLLPASMVFTIPPLFTLRRFSVSNIYNDYSDYRSEPTLRALSSRGNLAQLAHVRTIRWDGLTTFPQITTL